MAERPILRVAALLLTLCWLLFPSAAFATHHGEGVIDEVSMRLTYQPPAVPNAGGQLVVHLAMDNGEPITGVEVQFLRQVDFLGLRTIPLGTARSDASGDARTTLEATSEEEQTIVVRFAGDEHYEAAELTEQVALSPLVAVAPPVTGKAALSPISSAMPGLLGLTAAGVWLLMFGLIAFTVLAIRRVRPSVTSPEREKERSTT
jgi:5-hydroxyisourate hydrolase-like protein (transthyretin family)